MKIIPLRAVPNQRFTFSNGQDRWVIEIKVAISSMICNLWLNDDPVVLGSRIVAGVPIIWSPRLATDGNFGILTESGEEPWWEQFGTSQTLVFWESDMAIASSRFVDFRSRNISPSLAELTALVNTAMKIEDIGYYPPTWQSLQEAISYAVSVVRSHAPEQGQILLATQMLTSAMGGLIKWLSIDFAAGEWDDELVFSRASTATYWGPDGTLLEATVDEPRIQHDPVTGKALGLLVEPSSTNLVSNSLRPIEWTWSSSWDITPIQNIDGTMTAARVERVSSTNILTVSFTYSGSGALTITQVSRPDYGGDATGDVIRGLLRNLTKDIIGGAGSANVGTGELTGSCVSVTPLNDGWYETVFVYSVEDIPGPPEAGDDMRWYINEYNIHVGTVREIAGLQIETGTETTSHISTIDSPVTRAADNAEIDLSDVFNPDEGTLRITAQVPEGEVVASLGDIQVVSDSDEKKSYRMTYSDYAGVPTVTLGNGIHSKLEYFPEAQS